MFSREDLVRTAAATGFQAEALEKVLRLLELLETLRSHPFLKERIALKGGTALNLFVFDVPRLSVDIDLNYVGSGDREVMLLERPKLEQAIQAVCGRLGIRVRRVPSEHAGGKWRLSYDSVASRTGTLELDMNFILRTPLWPLRRMNSRPVGPHVAQGVPVLDLHELAAGKLAALFSRNAARDLFDAVGLLQEADLDPERLRLASTIYGGASRRDWRTISLDDVDVSAREVERQLLPMLRADLVPTRSDVPSWSRRLVEECRDLLSVLVPLRSREREFLTRLNDDGEIVPDLLTGDERMRAVIGGHPGLQWKAKNVRQHRKGPGEV